MRLSELIEGLGRLHPSSPPADPEIRDLAYDSRRTQPGDLFVALRGMRTDGHRFVAAAAAAGAVAAAVEDPSAVPPPAAGLPLVEVPDSRTFLALASHRLYDYPSRHMWLAGVTGTDGKTTTAYLIRHLLAAAGLRVALITTVVTGVGDNLHPSERTTPEAPDICRLLRDALASGGSHAVMEVSSHALALKRTLGLEFDVVALTNITQDHLDFHGTVEEYARTKLGLFRDYPQATSKATAGVLNADDPLFQMFKQEAHCPIVSVGFAEEATFRITGVAPLRGGTQVQIRSPEGLIEFRIPLYGSFNARNATTASAVARLAGFDWPTISSALTDASAPPGRLEAVDQGQPFSVFVDYAHTPEALDTVLQAVREIAAGRVIVVFGCGGDRDRSKRPKMGAIAARLANIVVVTSDNPRSEDPQAIIAEILQGMPPGDTLVEPDRARAIETALRLARPGDVVLLAGKGHETYQQFADRTIPFDDREVARAALRSMSSSTK